jgi:glycine cleavage system H lipoate-binding protein
MRGIMDVEGYNMPEDLYYEKDHYWVKEDGVSW